MLTHRKLAIFPVFPLLVAALWADGETASVGTKELLRRILSDQAPIILDVRSSEEYKSGHIHGAVNIPHSEVVKRIGEIEKFRERVVVVHCERGVRASHAEAVLRENGFVKVRHLEGDLSEWRKNGLPLEKGSPSKPRRSSTPLPADPK